MRHFVRESADRRKWCDEDFDRAMRHFDRRKWNVTTRTWTTWWRTSTARALTAGSDVTRTSTARWGTSTAGSNEIFDHEILFFSLACFAGYGTTTVTVSVTQNSVAVLSMCMPQNILWFHLRCRPTNKNTTMRWQHYEKIDDPLKIKIRTVSSSELKSSIPYSVLWFLKPMLR